MIKNFIDGQFRSSTASEHIDVLNPSNGKVLDAIPDTPAAEVAEAIAAAKRAQPAWGKLPAIVRAGHLRRLSTAIRGRHGEIARTIAEEQGKLLALAEIEVTFTADYIDYMAEWARRIEGEIIPSDREGEQIFLFRKPIGVVAGILPWNFPFFPDRQKDGARVGDGQHDRHQTQRGNSAQCSIVCRDRRRQ